MWRGLKETGVIKVSGSVDWMSDGSHRKTVDDDYVHLGQFEMSVNHLNKDSLQVVGLWSLEFGRKFWTTDIDLYFVSL